MLAYGKAKKPPLTKAEIEKALSSERKRGRVEMIKVGRSVYYKEREVGAPPLRDMIIIGGLFWEREKGIEAIKRIPDKAALVKRVEEIDEEDETPDFHMVVEIRVIIRDSDFSMEKVLAMIKWAMKKFPHFKSMVMPGADILMTTGYQIVEPGKAYKPRAVVRLMWYSDEAGKGYFHEVGTYNWPI